MTSILFPLGQIVATPAALDATLGNSFATFKALLERHGSGDWGDIDSEDKGQNELALKNGSRIFSVYKVGPKTFWVITESSREITTILLPEDY